MDPKALVVYSRLHAGCELVVQDSACLCGEGEEVSFLTLQLRAQSVGQVGIPAAWESTECAPRYRIRALCDMARGAGQLQPPAGPCMDTLPGAW